MTLNRVHYVTGRKSLEKVHKQQRSFSSAKHREELRLKMAVLSLARLEGFLATAYSNLQSTDLRYGSQILFRVNYLQMTMIRLKLRKLCSAASLAYWKNYCSSTRKSLSSLLETTSSTSSESRTKSEKAEARSTRKKTIFSYLRTILHI